MPFSNACLSIDRLLSKYPKCKFLEFTGHFQYFRDIIYQYLINPDENLCESSHLQQVKKISFNPRNFQDPELSLVFEDELVYFVNNDEISCVQAKVVELATSTYTYHTFEGFLGFENIQGHISFTDFKNVDPLIQENYNKVVELAKESRSTCDKMLFIANKKHIIGSVMTKNDGKKNPKLHQTRFTHYKPKMSPSFYCLTSLQDFSGLRDVYDLKFIFKMHRDHFKASIEKVKENSIFTVSFADQYNFDKMMNHGVLYELFSLNILEFKYEKCINNKKLLDALIKGIESNTKIRDLELVVPNNSYVFSILKALQNNFMIKTIRVMSKHQISNEMLQYMKKFRAQRIGVEIALNTQKKLFRAVEDKSTEMYYPD